MVCADLLTAIKQGKLDYSTEVAPILEKAMDVVEQYAAESTLPDKVDRSYWDRWLIGIYERYVL